jgi:hypothetical protein
MEYPPFDTLDTVGWTNFWEADGIAEAIPAALCNLVSPWVEISIAAWQMLLVIVCASRKIIDASIYSVSFLLDWLSELQSEEKCGQIIQLARWVRVNSFKRQHLKLTEKVELCNAR